jgi:hypothetical protein
LLTQSFTPRRNQSGQSWTKYRLAARIITLIFSRPKSATFKTAPTAKFLISARFDIPRIEKMKPLSFHCPHCNQHIEAEPAWAGRDLDCPNCRKPFIVPAGQRKPEWFWPTCILTVGLVILVIVYCLPQHDLSTWQGTAWITGLVLFVWGMGRLAWQSLEPGAGGRITLIFGIAIMAISAFNDSIIGVVVGGVIALLGGGAIALHKLRPRP